MKPTLIDNTKIPVEDLLDQTIMSVMASGYGSFFIKQFTWIKDTKKLDKRISVFTISEYLKSNDKDKRQFEVVSSCIGRGLCYIRAYLDVAKVEWYYDNHKDIEEFVNLYLIVLAAKMRNLEKKFTKELVPMYIVQILDKFEQLKNKEFKEIDKKKIDFIERRTDIFADTLEFVNSKKVDDSKKDVPEAINNSKKVDVLKTFNDSKKVEKENK